MIEKATFAAGCFWGVEAAFRQSPGVTETRVGYTGGHTQHPSYEAVCSHRTGHAEAVEVTFDPAEISYEELLDVFWRKHNPRSRNRQGFDIGSQYRSAIFYHSPEQEAAARADKERLQAELRWGQKIRTQIEPAGEFWEAEHYHQQYLERRGRATCHADLKQAV